ncbi:MAG: CapA family protein [Desulfuromonadales bacterium]
MLYLSEMERSLPPGVIDLFLCGDVMPGRGIDQILPQSAPPELFEPRVRDARRYVELTERLRGPIPRRVDFAYVWGDALAELKQRQPALRIVNLETSLTAGGEHWPGKAVHYRMHPRNVPLLKAAAIDVCALANNHVLDWGYDGLAQTLAALHSAGIRSAGAGGNRAAADAPAVVEMAGQGRVIVLSVGTGSSGIPATWAASADRAGVSFLPEVSSAAVRRIGNQVRRVKRPGDVVVLSIHWGGNWGYAVPAAHRWFAHRLLDCAGVDLVHGHSSHHALGIEVHRGKLILYGCGDLVTDYEGIRGYEAFRGDLGLMYFVRLETATSKLASLEMTPMQMRRFRLGRAARQDAALLRDLLSREGRGFGVEVQMRQDGTLVLCRAGE